MHRALEADNVAHDVISMEGLVDINLQTNVQIDLSYDDETDRFIRASKRRRLYIRKTLKSMFVPEGVSSDYYGFMIWRVVQRYINAILQVFGTQSLLLSLGKKRSLTQAAALNWILKDTLGKLTRMLYGSFASNKLDAGKDFVHCYIYGFVFSCHNLRRKKMAFQVINIVRSWKFVRNHYVYSSKMVSSTWNSSKLI